MRCIAAALLLLASTTVSSLPRSGAEVRAFRATHACPATARHRGPCPGFQVDHTIPLCAGGLDRRENMKWLSVEDHKWKTFVDQRECRKLRVAAGRPAK